MIGLFYWVCLSIEKKNVTVEKIALCSVCACVCYLVNAKVLMNFSSPLPFDAYIWNWVWRSADSLCCFIRHSDLAVMLWPHSVILVKKRFSKVPCCQQWALWKTSKCLSHCSSTQRKQCLYCFLSALISSLSEEAHLLLVLFTYRPAS